MPLSPLNDEEPIDFFQSNRPFRDRVFSVKVSAILRLLESDGWSLVAIRGSHRQFKHAVKPGRVTVADNPATTWLRVL